MSHGAGSKTGVSTDTWLIHLEAAWRERIDEANLLSTDHHATAIASRLYAVEIGIKVLICRKLGLTHLPNHCRTHDLDEIIIFAGLRSHLNDPTNLGLKQNWDVLKKFSKDRLNEVRYLPVSLVTTAERDRIIMALDDNPDGVWTWLSSLL